MTPEQRDEIIRLCAEDELSVRAIAERVGVSHATVSRTAKAAGIKFSEERVSQTAEATATRIRRVRQQRLDLAEQLIEDAFRTRARMWAEHKMYERGADGLVLVTLPMPSIKDQRDGYHTIQAQVDAHDKLMAGVEDNSAESRKNLMANLMAGIQDVRAQLDEKPPEATL